MIAEMTEPATPTGFRALNLIPPLNEALERIGLSGAQPHPGRHHPRRPRRPGRHRPGQDRDRQDRRLRHPVHRDARRPRTGQAAGHHHGPDPRAGPAGRRGGREARPQPATSAVCGIYGGEPVGGQLAELRPASTIDRRHPGPRPRPPVERRPSTSARSVYVVLDEADRMLDIGFRPRSSGSSARVPQSRARPCCCRPPCSADVRKLGPPLHDRAGAGQPVAGRA